MIIKSSIAKNIKRSVPHNKLTSWYLFSVEQQFTKSNKVLAGILTNKLTSMKYDGFSGVRKCIMKIRDIAEKLNNLGMTVSKNFFIQFVLRSLPSQFIQFKFYYNTHKES